MDFSFSAVEKAEKGERAVWCLQWTVYVWCVAHGKADVGVCGVSVVFTIVKVVTQDKQHRQIIEDGRVSHMSEGSTLHDENHECKGRGVA